MEIMSLNEATAAYNEFVQASKEAEEMPFESWIEFENIVVA